MSGFEIYGSVFPDTPKTVQELFDESEQSLVREFHTAGIFLQSECQMCMYCGISYLPNVRHWCKGMGEHWGNGTIVCTTGGF